MVCQVNNSEKKLSLIINCQKGICVDLSKNTQGQSPASRKINILGLTLCIIPCVYVVLFILHVALHPNQNV